MTIKYTDYEMYLRRHILTTLMRQKFDNNRAIYECADEWMENFMFLTEVLWSFTKHHMM